MRLKNKVAIVTGAAGGIGLAIATAFAAEGAMVVLSDIDEAKLNQEAKHLAANGAKTLAVKTDVGNTEDVKNLVHQPRSPWCRAGPGQTGSDLVHRGR